MDFLSLTNGLRIGGPVLREPEPAPGGANGSPFQVDKGPPGTGAPPPDLKVASPQKEVAADEPKTQASILDLLEEILPVDLGTLLVQQGRPHFEDRNGAAKIGVSLGDLKLSASHLSLDKVLAALGVELPADINALDKGQIKKAVAEQIVAQGLPPNLRGLLASLLQVDQSHASLARVPAGTALQGSEPLGQPAVGDVGTRRSSGINLLERDVVDALRIREITVRLPEPPKLDIEKVADRPTDGKPFAKKPATVRALSRASLRRVYDVTLRETAANLAAKAVIRPTKMLTAAVAAPDGKPGTAANSAGAQDGKATAQPIDLKLHANMGVREAVGKRHSVEVPLVDESAPSRLEATIKPDQPVHVSQPTERTTIPARSKTDFAHEIVAENRMRIIDHVQEIAAMRGAGKVTIRLHPEELGTITVTVRSLGAAVTAEITASNESVRNALHVQRGDLVNSIESRGLSLNSLTVGQEAAGEAQAQGQGDAQSGHAMRQEFERASNLWSVRTPATEPAMAASTAIVADRAVDYLA